MTFTPPPHIVYLSAKAQFTIPQPLRRHLGVQPGSKLELIVRDRDLLIRPIRRSVAAATAGSLRRYVAKDKLGRSWEEIIETTKTMVSREQAEKETRR
jgi:AbrB family looped-hinge helix DNA binding protein